MVVFKCPSRHGGSKLPIQVITSPPSRPCQSKRRPLRLRPLAQAGSGLKTDAAISVRGLQLSFGGGGSRKQVRCKNSSRRQFISQLMFIIFLTV